MTLTKEEVELLKQLKGAGEREEGKPYPLRHLLEHIPTIVDVKARLDLLDRNQARPGAVTLDRIFSAHCR
jgi:hypothetical protein